MEIPEKVKIALIFGPMTGGKTDTHSRHTIEQMYKSGFRTVYAHWRNTTGDEDGDEPKSLLDFTSTEEVDQVIKHIHEQYPEAPIYLVGLSLGGNMVLRWAAENTV